MIGVSIESILQQVAQLPLSERQLLKQLLNDRTLPSAFPPEPELFLTQAAELLNVSVSFVEGLLISGELKSAATGQPTIKLADLLAYNWTFAKFLKIAIERCFEAMEVTRRLDLALLSTESS